MHLILQIFSYECHTHLILTDTWPEGGMTLLVPRGTAVTPLSCDSFSTQTLPCGLVTPMAHCTHWVALACWGRQVEKERIKVKNEKGHTKSNVAKGWLQQGSGGKKCVRKREENYHKIKGISVSLAELDTWREMTSNTTQNKAAVVHVFSCNSSLIDPWATFSP